VHGRADAEPGAVLAELRAELKLSSESGSIWIHGDEPPGVHPFKLGTAGAVAAGLQAAAVTDVWRRRSGRAQDASIDVPRALQTLHQGPHTRQNGYLVGAAPKVGGDPVPDLYRTADDRWCCLVIPHNTRRHQIERTLEVLGVGSRRLVSSAVAGWNAEELEEAIYANGAVAGVARAPSEWERHPQGEWLAGRPLIDVERISDGEVEHVASASRPLEGVRVLEMTHIIAGPTIGRVLAEQGADVLHVCPPGHADPIGLVIELGVGKRSIYLDLDEHDDHQRLLGLIAEADVFVNSYRPGALARRGLSPEELAALRPGIIIVSVDCFGRKGGPWAERRGVDPIAQAVSGIADGHLGQGICSLVRGGPLSDPLAGYLGAAGAVAALCRRSDEGGSYTVDLSLARIAMWVIGFGTQNVTTGSESLDNTYRAFASPRLISMASPFGQLDYLAPLAQYEETAAFWASPSVPRGSSVGAWLS
jgi:crotonobetainyl-CoA:carnitine CoA-transferase CaiB-like acyl-CoA transferase